MASNRFCYTASLLLLLTACRQIDHVTVSDPGLYIKNEHCNHQESLKASTRKKLARASITRSATEKVHLQVLFRGKNDRFICLVNCNAGFQDPKFLGFFDGKELKIMKNSSDLDALYREYLAFKKAGDPDDPAAVWDYIGKFAKQELLNKYNRIGF